MATRLEIDLRNFGVAWTTSTSYTVDVNAGLVVEVGNNRTPSPAVIPANTFTTFASGPSVSSVSPALGSTSSFINTATLTYNRIIFDQTATNYYLYKTVGSTATLISTISSTGTRITKTSDTVKVDLTDLIEGSSNYHLRADTGAVSDIFNFKSLPINDNSVFQYVTTSGPQVISVIPAYGTTGTFVSTATLTFNRAVDLYQNNIYLYNNSGVFRTFVASTSTNLYKTTASTIAVTVYDQPLPEGEYYIGWDLRAIRDNFRLPADAVTNNSVLKWTSTSINAVQDTRNYNARIVNDLFETNTPSIIDQDPSTATQYTLSLSSTVGTFTSTVGTLVGSTWTYTATKTELNNVFNTLNFTAPNPLYNPDGTYTFNLSKKGTAIATQARSLVGIPFDLETGRNILVSNTYTNSVGNSTTLTVTLNTGSVITGAGSGIVTFRANYSTTSTGFINTTTNTATTATIISYTAGNESTDPTITLDTTSTNLQVGTLFTIQANEANISNYTVTNVTSNSSFVVRRPERTTIGEETETFNGAALQIGAAAENLDLYQFWTSGPKLPFTYSRTTSTAVVVTTNFTGVSIGTSTVVNNVSTLTLAPNVLSTGTYTIFADWAGSTINPKFNSTISNSISQVLLAKSPVTSNISIAPNPFYHRNEDGVTYSYIATATVTLSNIYTTHRPTGTVDLYDASTLLGTANVNASTSVASIAWNVVDANQLDQIKTLTAIYNGDEWNLNSTTSTVFRADTRRASSPLTLTLSTSTIRLTQNFTATVTGDAGFYAGKDIQLFESPSDFISTTTINTVVTLNGSNFFVGTASIYATYPGNFVYNSTVSNTVTVQVTKFTAPITIAAEYSSTTVKPNLMKFNVISNHSFVEPTTVQYYMNNSLLGTSTFSSGTTSTSLTTGTSIHSTGTYSVYATILENNNYTNSTATAITQTIANVKIWEQTGTIAGNSSPDQSIAYAEFYIAPDLANVSNNLEHLPSTLGPANTATVSIYLYGAYAPYSAPFSTGTLFRTVNIPISIDARGSAGASGELGVVYNGSGVPVGTTYGPSNGIGNIRYFIAKAGGTPTPTVSVVSPTYPTPYHPGGVYPHVDVNGSEYEVRGFVYVLDYNGTTATTTVLIT